MRSKRPLRSAFVVTLGATTALLGACGGMSDGDPATGDGGSAEAGNCPISRNPPAPQCPTVQPASGSSCECYSSGFACVYGNGMCNGMPDPVQAMCSNGKWQIAVATCNPPGVPPDSGTDSGDGGVGDGASIDAQHTD